SAYSVSKASEDLPEPESPVITTSFSRGNSRLMFLRLCVRAPRMRMVGATLLFSKADFREGKLATIAPSRRLAPPFPADRTGGRVDPRSQPGQGSGVVYSYSTRRRGS